MKCLVIINQGVGGAALSKLIRDHAKDVRFDLVVPATRRNTTESKLDARMHAQRVLQEVLRRFRSIGADVAGQCGRRRPRPCHTGRPATTAPHIQRGNHRDATGRDLAMVPP
jgi:hypothetical protein